MESYENDSENDCVRVPAKYVQVVIAPCLRTSRKKNIFYEFNCQKYIELVSNQQRINYSVLGVVSHIRPTNRKLWED